MRGGEGRRRRQKEKKKRKKRTRTDFTLQYTVSLQTKPSLKFLLHPIDCVSCTCLPGAKSLWDATYSTPCRANCLHGAHRVTTAASLSSPGPARGTWHWAAAKVPATPALQGAYRPRTRVQATALPLRRRRAAAGGCRRLMTPLHIPSSQYAPVRRTDGCSYVKKAVRLRAWAALTHCAEEMTALHRSLKTLLIRKSTETTCVVSFVRCIKPLN